MRSGERIRNMSLRSLRAAGVRAWLRSQLGGRCRKCGATDHLEFHLKVGDGAKHHLMSAKDRVYFYVQQFVAGNLDLLCGGCHGLLTVAQSRARRLERLYSGSRGVSSVAATTGTSTPHTRLE